MLNIRITLLFACISSTYIIVAFAKANVNIITKAQWGSAKIKVQVKKLRLPVPRVIVSHTASWECHNFQTCVHQIRGEQHYHMNYRDFDDIAYNFLIDSQGTVYEGRGWEKEGAFAKGYNVGSLGISLIGNFQEKRPSDRAVGALYSLLEMGVRHGKIAYYYKLLGHCQVSETLSPGEALYNIIKRWPRWSSKV